MTEEVIERLESLIPFLEAHHCSADAVRKAIDAIQASQAVGELGEALIRLVNAAETVAGDFGLFEPGTEIMAAIEQAKAALSTPVPKED